MLSASESLTAKSAEEEAERIQRMSTPWALAINATDCESRQVAVRWLVLHLFESVWRLSISSEIDEMREQLEILPTEKLSETARNL